MGAAEYLFWRCMFVQKRGYDGLKLLTKAGESGSRIGIERRRTDV